MSDGLFYLTGPDLVAMRVTPYDAEHVLQALIAKHPDLLAGGQMTPADPRRWLLISREQSIPDSDTMVGRFSLDHLFVDQDAVPTLVEVKRSTDTRIRREVVGQMLDYAANGVRFWPAAALQAAFEATQRAAESDPLAAVTSLRDVPPSSLESFFDEVEGNLRSGRIRLVFVADRIPDELRRIIEFLNEQMSQVDVLGIEVKQYRADGREDLVIVPTLIGRTGVTTTKPSQRGTTTHEEALASASQETRELVGLVDGLAEDLGLLATDSPSGRLLKTPRRETLATVYLPWNALQIPIHALRMRGWSDEAERFLAILRSCTPRQLPEKTPSVGTEDAVANWASIREVLTGIAHLYELEAPG